MSRSPAYQLIWADCGRRVPLADGSIHAVVTSPPYFALRSYEGVSPTEWPELAYAPMPGLPPVVVPAMTCCLGAEPDPAAFVGHLVRVFDDVKRVLHKSGCAWVNLGDSYATTPAGYTVPRDLQPQSDRFNPMGMAACLNQLACKTPKPTGGLPVKNMLMIPARFALAMQACGWYLRSAPPWIKPGNAMPESVNDRPTTAHEFLFMFTKSPDYYFDLDSVRRPSLYAHLAKYTPGTRGTQPAAAVNGKRDSSGGVGYHPAGRSLRTADLFLDSLDELIAWHLDRIDHLTRARQSGGMVADDDGDPAAVLVNPEAFKGSHYAVMPRRLAEILVKCSTPEAGVCQCGAPWERVVEREPGFQARRDYDQGTRGRRSGAALDSDYRGVGYTRSTHLGWRPTCPCPPGPTVPARVFDPFVGSGTTLLIANALGRDGIGIDASDYYLRMAARRLDRPHSRPLIAASVGPEPGPGPLFGGS